jgi:hypothetical protein
MKKILLPVLLMMLLLAGAGCAQKMIVKDDTAPEAAAENTTGDLFQGWQTYQSVSPGFSLRYPALKSANLAEKQVELLESGNKQPKLSVSINMPGAKMGADGCLMQSSTLLLKKRMLPMNGVTFCESIQEEGAAGSTYRTQTYSTILSKRIVVIEYTFHFPTDVRIYAGCEDSPETKQMCKDLAFDEVRDTALIQKILSSFQITNAQQGFFEERINILLSQGVFVNEITDPKFALPVGVDAGQVKKYFQIGDVYFALVMQNSLNVVLSLPEKFEPSFVGVLVARQGGTQWMGFWKMKDLIVESKNNPYYLFVDQKKLQLTVVDQNGAGSGEGIMNLFVFSDKNDWKSEGCYYFGANYTDESADGDYFAYSTKISKQIIQPVASCKSIQITSSLK